MTGQLRLLLWLRFRTMVRQRSALAWVGLVALLGLVVIPMSLGGGFLVWFGTKWAARQPDPRLLAEWTHLTVFFLWSLFLLRQVLSFGANEFYDITKLFHFPVSHRTVFLAQTLGQLLVGSALLYVPALVALAVALPGSAALAAVRLVVLLLFLFHGVALGQLLQLALLSVLRSRRFRDMAPIFGALISGGFYLAFRFLSEAGDPQDLFRSLLERNLSAWLAPLPPYWLAGALIPGAGLPSILLLILGFLPLTALAVVLAASLQERAFHGEIAASKVRATTKEARRERPARFPLSLLPDSARAVAGKELSLLAREPVVKAMLIAQFVFFVVPLAFAIWSAGGGEGAGRLLRWAVYPFLFIESSLVLNLFGLEGSGLGQSLVTPVSRDHLLLGKLLAYFSLFGVVNLGVLGSAAFGLLLMGQGPGVADLALLATEATAALLVLLGIGAVFSVLAPSRLAARGRGALAQGQAERVGCGVVALRALALVPLALLVAPVTLLSRLTGSLPLTLAGLVYSGAVYMAGYRFGAHLLRAREEKLSRCLGRSPE